MTGVSGQWPVASGRKTAGGRSIALPSPLSSLPSPRSGITLLEVLVSLGVLSFGLLMVVALIPLGAISLRDAVQADRTGAAAGPRFATSKRGDC